MCRLAYNERIYVGAVAAMLSVAMRQTNIVWVAFVTALLFARALIDRQRRADRSLPSDPTIAHLVYHCLHKLSTKPASFLGSLFASLFSVYPFLAVFAIAGACAYANGGLAMGDKTAHLPHFHIPQLFYCTVAICAFGGAQLVSLKRLTRLLVAVRRHWRLFLVATIASALLVHQFTYEHPYLLADNRHYTFYLWRRVFSRFMLARYILVPVYLLCLLVLADSMRASSHLWRLGYITATALVVVPNLLLEPRYFILPFCLWRMHCDSDRNRCSSWCRTCVELVGNVAINLATTYMFLYKPFHWPHEHGIQRFMW